MQEFENLKTFNDFRNYITGMCGQLIEYFVKGGTPIGDGLNYNIKFNEWGQVHAGFEPKDGKYSRDKLTLRIEENSDFNDIADDPMEAKINFDHVNGNYSLSDLTFVRRTSVIDIDGEEWPQEDVFNIKYWDSSSPSVSMSRQVIVPVYGAIERAKRSNLHPNKSIEDSVKELLHPFVKFLAQRLSSINSH